MPILRDEDIPQKHIRVEPLAEHTVVEGDTLGSIALKYYGSAEREKWMPIYEANKAAIGDNPSIIRLGTVLKIPKLPA